MVAVESDWSRARIRCPPWKWIGFAFGEKVRSKNHTVPDQGFQQLQKQSQSMVLAPQLRQSLKILQAPTMELRSSILEELQINPTLEELPMEGVSLDESTDDPDDGEPDGEMDFEKEDFDVLNRLDESWRDAIGGDSAPRTTTLRRRGAEEALFRFVCRGDLSPGAPFLPGGSDRDGSVGP